MASEAAASPGAFRELNGSGEDAAGVTMGFAGLIRGEAVDPEVTSVEKSVEIMFSLGLKLQLF